MSGISSSVGLISGLNTDQIISQLLQIEARPKTLAQQRILQLQGQQAAYLDINVKLTALKTAAGAFRANNVFDAVTATSTNSDVLTASATAGAPAGSYAFLVNKVVSTQQVLSRGFTDRDTTATGLTKLTFEPETARLDRDTYLSDLNAGAGIRRGKVEVTDSAGHTALIDLSTAATVNDVLDAFNASTDVRVKVEAKGSKLVVTDLAGGGGTLRIADVGGGSTATDLGLTQTAVAGKITGSNIYTLGNGTSLQSLRDGLGVGFNTSAGTGGTYDFDIQTRDGSSYAIDIGDVYELVSGEFKKTKAAVATVEQLAQRIHDQTEGKVTLTVSSDGQSLVLNDSTSGADDFKTTARSNSTALTDLGLDASTTAAAITGRKVLASLNSTLASNLAGGAGLASGAFNITTRDGQNFAFSISTDSSISDIADALAAQTGNRLKAVLNATGTGLTITDTSSGPSNLIIQGAGAEALGIDTAVSGVADGKVAGDRLQRRYITTTTTLASLNAGSGVGTGSFEIIGPTGQREVVDIGSDSKNINDVIKEINSKNVGILAKVNDNGDGIILTVDPSVSSPSAKIKVTDLSGAVAKNLNIAGEAADTSSNNFINGSFERSVTLDGTENLDQLVTKINAANVRVRASVVRDNNGASPFRLRLTSSLTGEAGRFILSSEGADLGLTTVTRGDNARIFFGSDDPATAILATSTTNNFSNLIDGVTITAKAASTQSVTVSVAEDDSAIVDAAKTFISAFNDAIARIDKQSRYNVDTQTGGPLVGESAPNQLRSALFNTIIRKGLGVTGTYQYLSQVGIRIGPGGALQLDETKLRDALEADPENVKNLFAASSQEPNSTRRELSPGVFVVESSQEGAYTQRGIAELLAATVDQFIDRTDGILTRASNTLGDQIDLQNDRIAAIDKKLESRQLFLQNQFATLETTLAQLQTQQSALAGISRTG